MLRILLLSALTAISIAFSPNAGLTNTALHRSSLSSTSLKMADEVKVGDELPSVVLKEGQANYETPVDVNLSDLTAGKKVAIFAVPGAFTPGELSICRICWNSHSPKLTLLQGCSKSHLPSFITAQDELKAKGVDMTVCIATNDAYVMEVRMHRYR